VGAEGKKRKNTKTSGRGGPRPIRSSDPKKGKGDEYWCKKIEREEQRRFDRKRTYAIPEKEEE